MKKTLFICMLLATALLYAQPSAAKSKKKKTGFRRKNPMKAG